ncbi:MAG TPA: rhomboid family intramembrane serine protease [Planctomycetota bacterium]|nr:rhomboid family intramembrane serine protease [Planctomycetota bacterium]
MKSSGSFDARGPDSLGGSFSPSSNVTKKLLWANGIVFVVTFLLDAFLKDAFRPIWNWIALDPSTWYSGVPAVWQLWTYGFLHSTSDATHILFNMLVLYFFGTMLEGQVGSRRFALQYFTALAVGGIVHLALVPFLGDAPVVGASGAVLYTVVACAVLQPDAPVIFFFVTLPLKVMAMILVGLDIFNLLRPGGSRTASDVHLAGAALGFVAARAGWIWFDPGAWRRARRARRSAEVEADASRRLDQLLERIHRDGIHTLSQRDKDFLSRMSKRD